MKVLMLGWEFPPFISGGLGTACYGLTRALDALGVEISFVLPRVVTSAYAPQGEAAATAGDCGPCVVFHREEFQHVRFLALGVPLRPYLRPGVRQVLSAAFRGVEPGSETDAAYEGDLFADVERYARLVCEVAAGEVFDVIHAHDWMTFPAAVAVSVLTGKPLVVHVHSTEFDRCTADVHPRIFEIERRGMRAADAVIAVSRLTRHIIIDRYGIDADRVQVVYNATRSMGSAPEMPVPPIRNEDKVVLFLGRVTPQKGPGHFLEAARRVLEVEPQARFLVAGTGELVPQMVEQAAAMGIGDRVLFTGFLHGTDVERAFRMAHLYVMPSVSEPFGIAALEALSCDVPVLISKQSGVAEVLRHVLRADFWDVDDLADQIIAVLRHAPLRDTLADHAPLEVRRLSWTDAAKRCLGVYEAAVAQGPPC